MLAELLLTVREIQFIVALLLCPYHSVQCVHCFGRLLQLILLLHNLALQPAVEYAVKLYRPAVKFTFKLRPLSK